MQHAGLTSPTLQLVTPAAVLACGACSDALVDTKVWWLALTPLLVLGLLAEGGVFALVTWLRRIDSVSPRAFPAAAAMAVLVLVLFGGGGFLVGLSAVAFILLPAAGWSLFRNYGFAPALTWVRVGLICLGLCAGLWRAWPTHRDTDQLLDVAIVATRFHLADGWIIDELRRRPQSVSALNRFAVAGRDDAAVARLREILGGGPITPTLSPEGRGR